MWSEQGDVAARRCRRATRRARNASAAALLAYDVPHRAPWDWRVSLYTWTKGIAAGAYLVARAARRCSARSPGRARSGGASRRSLALARSSPLTGALLICGPRAPASASLIFTRPQWRSWLVARRVHRSSAYGARPRGAPRRCRRRRATRPGVARGRRRSRCAALPPSTPRSSSPRRRRATSGRARCCRRTCSCRRSSPARRRSADSPSPAPARRIGRRRCARRLASPRRRCARCACSSRGARDDARPHRDRSAHARLAVHELVRAAGTRCRFAPALAALAGGRSRSSTRTSRPGGGAARADVGLAARVRARPRPGRRRTVAARRDVLPRPAASTSRVPAERALGRLGRARPAAWPKRVERRYMLVPTTCFNCESACGLLAYVDHETLEVRKFEGNPEHPGSRGPQLRQGPGDAQPDHRPRPRSSTRCGASASAARAAGSAWRGTRRSTTSPARIRAAIAEGRRNEVMYHVGRPGEDGFTERVLAAWGVDGHNSHTNICSARGARRLPLLDGARPPEPRPRERRRDPADQRAPRVGPLLQPARAADHGGKQRGAKLIVLDTRLSNTATHADHWISPRPGSEAAILLAIARPPDRDGRVRPRVRAPLVELAGVPRARARPTGRRRSSASRPCCATIYARLHVRVRRARESGVAAATLARGRRSSSPAPARALSTHIWRTAAAGNLGGWQVARCLFLLNALLGAVATRGRHVPERVEQVRAAADPRAAAPARRGTSSPGPRSTRSR